ncbi:MAG: DUF4292 domain-containing protein, partial [Bacteroidota bacterium]|nr:DUF4292 domain-containing protein [Bacteroidota bacterium]
MQNRKEPIIGKLVFVILIISIISSCKIKKDFVFNKKSIKTLDLIENVKNNNLDFEEILIRNVKISYQDKNRKIRFSGIIKIQKDSSILIGITAPLGIEIARIKISRDSVFVIDRKNKQYFKGNINVFDRFFKYPVTYN